MAGRFVRVNGELAEVVPTVSGRAKLVCAKLVYLAREPEGRFPTEVEYSPLHLGDRLRGEGRLLGDPDVLLIERVEPDLRHPLNLRKLVRQLLAKLGL